MALKMPETVHELVTHNAIYGHMWAGNGLVSEITFMWMGKRALLRVGEGKELASSPYVTEKNVEYQRSNNQSRDDAIRIVILELW